MHWRPCGRSFPDRNLTEYFSRLQGGNLDLKQNPKISNMQIYEISNSYPRP